MIEDDKILVEKLQARGYVDSQYVVNTNEEILLFGSQLQIGMRILIVSTMFRRDLSKWNTFSAKELEQVEKWNRWAVVRNHILHNHGENCSMVNEYDDRTVHVIDMDIAQAWIVKRDSIPPSYVYPSAPTPFPDYTTKYLNGTLKSKTYSPDDLVHSIDNKEG